MTTTLTRKTVAAATTTQDAGEFTAIAACYSIDRQGEAIAPGAFTDTIAQWRASGRDIPLAWDHGRAAEAIIGSVSASTMREIPGEGLFVEGRLDLQDSEVAREAWRSVKANRVGLSFGYMVVDEHDQADGTKVLDALDVMEITVTSVPANADARVLSAKAAAAPTTETGGAVALLDSMIKEARTFVGGEPEAGDKELMNRVLAALLKLQASETSEGEKTVVLSSEKAIEQPIQFATFAV